jgi:hypothetical protein
MGVYFPTETAFWGSGWKPCFEKMFGSLPEAPARSAGGALGPGEPFGAPMGKIVLKMYVQRVMIMYLTSFGLIHIVTVMKEVY